MENYFFYNFELISVFTLALYILLCDCKHEHAFDPIYAVIRSNLLSIKLKIGLFFCLFVFIPNRNANEPGKVVPHSCLDLKHVD